MMALLERVAKRSPRGLRSADHAVPATEQAAAFVDIQLDIDGTGMQPYTERLQMCSLFGSEDGFHGCRVGGALSEQTDPSPGAS